jgi:hypothetical protein
MSYDGRIPIPTHVGHVTEHKAISTFPEHLLSLQELEQGVAAALDALSWAGRWQKAQVDLGTNRA